jgi:hypothetical protein
VRNGRNAAQTAVTQGVAQLKDRVMGVLDAAKSAPATGGTSTATSAAGTTDAPSI